MHHALEIQEILLTIFGHCHLPDMERESSILAVLARTCRAFKDAALDVLWEEMDDLSPLARCLPGASHRSSPDNTKRCYAFSRTLTQTEWGILQSYTRRIRFIQSFHGLGRKSIRTLSKPPIAGPLFPSLCHVRFEHKLTVIPLLLLPFPSLIALDVVYANPRSFPNSLNSFAKLPPNLMRLSISVSDDLGVMDLGNLVHLSRMTALTQLNFFLSHTLADQITPSDPPLFFPNLHEFIIHSKSLDQISRLLSQTRLPTITDVAAYFVRCPSKQSVFSFLASLQTSVIGNTIQGLRLHQRLDGGIHFPMGAIPVLALEDLRPCMEFSNLCRIHFHTVWKVDLTDGDMLTLALAWPHLEQLSINAEWGWLTPGGITPNGLLQLLQKCPSLDEISLAMDTRGYTEFPRSPASLGLTLSRMANIDVVDSSIEAESVPAIAAFFAGITSRSKPLLNAWAAWAMEGSMNWDVYKSRWDDVFRRVKDALEQSS